MTRLTGQGTGVPQRGRLRWADFAVDCVAWTLALVVGALIGASGPLGGTAWIAVVVLALLASAVQFAVAYPLSLYRGRVEDSSLAHVRALAVTAVVAGIVVAAAGYILAAATELPSNAAIIAVPIAWVVLAVIRYVSRARADAAGGSSTSAQPTLVFGAGWLGRNLVRVMRTDRTSPYTPVGFIDDDPAMLGERVDGLSVLGGLDNLAALAARTQATAIVVSIARADGALLRRVSDLGAQLGLRVLVFPSLEEVLEGKSRLRDVRDIGIEDLIGR